MGRKLIKTTRHKKLKSVDPSFKGEKKKDERSNIGPEDTGMQEVPKKQESLFTPREKPKKKKRNQHKATVVVKRCDSGPELPGMQKKLKNLPKQFTKRKSESDFKFLTRVNDTVDKQFADVKLEEQYQIDVVTDEQILEQGLDAPKKIVSKKTEKRRMLAEKLKQKKKKKIEDRLDDFSRFSDKVQFGEVALHPPTLNVATKIMKIKKNEKAGKHSLLLKNLPNDVKQELHNSGLAKIKKLTGKRKDLSMAQRNYLENERTQAVSLYRQIKKEKNKKLMKQIKKSVSN